MGHRGRGVATVLLVLALGGTLLAAAGCGEPAPAGGSSSPSSGATSKQAASPSSSAPSPSPSAAPELVFSDPEFAFELRRTMSAIYAGEADLGECLATARRITDGDFESWYRQWHATAEHFRAVGDKTLAAGHEVSARQAYYRAATYYRTAEFFLHGDPKDPRIVKTWRAGRDAFVAAAELDTVPFERVRIPYEHTALPGCFYRGEASAGGVAADNGAGADSGAGDDGAAVARRPLLIVQTGFDGCQEELHPYALAAVERGYDVLTFEGPGQGQVIRVQHLPFRADWEHVVAAVLDYAVGRPDVDPDRIALWGISLGGYLAPRAAAYDHRLAAVIADGAVYDVGLSLLEGMKKAKAVPASMTEQELQGYLRTDPKEFNEAIGQEMKASTAARWQNEHGMYVFRASSPALFWAAYMDFTIEGAAGKIRCPTLVCYGDDDAFDRGGRQAKLLYEHLTCPKTLMRFTQRYEAGDHCQLGAFALSFARKLDWLDETLAAARR